MEYSSNEVTIMQAIFHNASENGGHNISCLNFNATFKIRKTSNIKTIYTNILNNSLILSYIVDLVPFLYTYLHPIHIFHSTMTQVNISVSFVPCQYACLCVKLLSTYRFYKTASTTFTLYKQNTMKLQP